MPLVRIDLDARTEPSVRKAISEGIHDSMVTVLGIPQGDRFQIITPHESGELIFDPSFLGVERRDVIFIQILLVRRQTAEANYALYADIAGRLAEHGIRKEDLFISIIDNQPEDWTAGQR
jgi:phenylpyruvate tautomerase PptA (4-oxalocrotonate tautomerase family)